MEAIAFVASVMYQAWNRPIEYMYDVRRLKYLTYKVASVRVSACVRAYAVEIKPGMLRAACFDDERV